MGGPLNQFSVNKIRLNDECQSTDGSPCRGPHQEPRGATGLQFSIHHPGHAGNQCSQGQQPGQRLPLPDRLETKLHQHQLGNRPVGPGADHSRNHQPTDRHTGPGTVASVEVGQAMAADPPDHQGQLSGHNQQCAGHPCGGRGRIDTKNHRVGDSNSLGDTLLEPGCGNHRVTGRQQQQRPRQNRPARPWHD